MSELNTLPLTVFKPCLGVAMGPGDGMGPEVPASLSQHLSLPPPPHPTAGVATGEVATGDLELLVRFPSVEIISRYLQTQLYALLGFRPEALHMPDRY